MLRLSMRGEGGATTALFRLTRVEKAPDRASALALPGRIFDQVALRRPGSALTPVIDPPSKTS